MIANPKACECPGVGVLRIIPRRMRSPGLGDVAAPALGYLLAGTQLVYNVTFSPGTVITPADAAQSVSQNVSRNSGIQVIGSNASTSFFALDAAFTLTLQLNQPYTNQAMVQSVLDSAVNAATGGVVSSNINVTSVPGAAPGTPLPGLNTAPVGTVPGSGTPNVPTAGAPTTSFFNQDSLGLGLNNGTYLAFGGILVLGFMLLRR